jgi:2'-hydroxyisoflavone reductase
MDVLLIGGPRFLGLALIEAALDGGHNVTMFNRGRTNPHLFPQVERLQGDRDGGIAALRGRRWDVVIDTCGYVPRVVRQSAELLASSVQRYLFISTISVYREPLSPGAAENAPLASLDDETVEAVTGETYGGLKVLCEQAVQAVFGEAALIIRPGLIVGPHDPTNRFTYWVTRMAEGGRVLAPDDRNAPVQFIDVRDLADWTLRMAVGCAGGVFNATGPAEPLTFEGILLACRRATGSQAEVAWVNPLYLLQAGVAPWTDIPLWAPGIEALNRVSIAAARAAGLVFRPLEQTILDTLTWARSQSPTADAGAGLSPTREAELLRNYQGQANP